MFEEKIKKYVNDQLFYASNKMACDPNLTTEHNLRNWINFLCSPFSSLCFNKLFPFQQTYAHGWYLLKYYSKSSK